MAINLNIESEDIDTEFRRIATDLMNNWILCVENSFYRITEIEFYYKSESHDDKYTHGHETQKLYGRWYFHGSGIDLTFGTPNSYGGILIRAIYEIKTKKYIYGPLNTVAELFRNLPDIYHSSFSFGLIEDFDKLIAFEKPISAPRIGLNSQVDSIMYNKFYRFLIMPKQKHADKTRIVEAMKTQNYDISEIYNVWG